MCLQLLCVLVFFSVPSVFRFFLCVLCGRQTSSRAYFAKATPTFTFRNRAGDAPCPVPIVCIGWPFPQFGVPHRVQWSREQIASQLFQNSVVIPL